MPKCGIECIFIIMSVRYNYGLIGCAQSDEKVELREVPNIEVA